MSGEVSWENTGKHASWGFKALHECHDVRYLHHAFVLNIFAGDPLRFLGSGYPPRQMLTTRKGGDWGSSGMVVGLCTSLPYVQQTRVDYDFGKQTMSGLR